MTLPLAITSLLEMAAHNNGFDRDPPPADPRVPHPASTRPAWAKRGKE